MNTENILISSKPIEISEYKNYKLATFMISVLDEYDLNGRMIPKDVGELYHQTIVGFPIVAKLITDSNGKPIDFRGHEVQVVKDENGNIDAKFGTMPIGSVLKSWIEERYVDGYEGLKSCIMIQAKLWSDRFPEYFAVLDKLWEENNVSSSWELSVENYEKTSKGKLLKVFSFVGNCLLGRNVMGAVPKAGVLEYAESQNVESFDEEELELAQALSLDNIQNSNINLQNPEKEDETKLNKENETILSDEVTAETATTIEDKQVEIVAEENVVEEAKEGILSTEDEQQTVVSEEVEVSETEKLNIKISELNTTISTLTSEVETKNLALAEASKTIQSLHVKIAELTPFKDQVEKAEQERIEAETIAKKETLKATVIATGQISKEEVETSETIKGLIDTLDEKELNQIIATRLIASLQKQEVTEQTVETSSTKQEVATASLVNDEVELEPKSIMKTFITGGRK